ncbi:MAG: peptidoglycan-binding protein [Caulobacteraceae bacterium]
MTAAAPWSVKGIDPRTREIAKDLARRSGMTLGEWLTHVIAEDGDTPAGGPERKAGDRPASENRTPRRGGDDLDRVFEALESLSTRFEASLQEQAETASRFDRAIADLKADQARVAERLQAAEQGGGAAGGGKVETLRALEGALNKVAGHLAHGEDRHREAMAEMRREMGEELSRVAEHVNLKVLEAENRSADAIFQVGAEITRVATSVEQRLRRADDAQAEALEKLGGEIARITERLSERIGASERRGAQSVEEVGQQVARMADRMHARQERSESELQERIRQSEERTARLLEEARQTIDRRLLRIIGAAPADDAPVASEFSERWTPVHETPAPETPVHETPVHQASAAEARSMGVLIDKAMAAGVPDVEEPTIEAEAEESVAAIDAEPDALVAPVDDQAEEPPLAVEAEVVEEPELEVQSLLEARYQSLTVHAEEEAVEESPYGDDDEDEGVDRLHASDDLEADGDSEDHLEALQAVADAITAEPLADEHEPEIADDLESEESLRPSTRDLIAEAKAAAFAERASYVHEEDEDEDDEGVTFSDLGARRPKPVHAMRGALLAGGAAAFMGLAGAGYVAMHPEMIHRTGGPASNPIPVGPPSSPTPAPAQAQQAAVALATAPTPRPVGPDLESLYRDASAKVDNGDASGVASLRTVANLGYAPAQRRLGKLYEDGGAGMDRDPVEGRRWTLRAAANGDVRAMHNLALDYYQGVGGPKSPIIAAQYFMRAAELGLRDSQYNLARFMEAGIGVQQDLPGAYRWYLSAARAGDSEAQARAAALKPRLSADQQSRAQALAGAFQPDLAAAPASMTALLRGANPKQLTLAQRALAKLGYYKGPDDGEASQALGEAIQSYQRERGLAANGQLSPELLQTFAHIVQ